MIPVLKPIFDLAVKFFFNVHLLLIIVFSVFHFVPGAYVDDELIVEQVQNSTPATESQSFFFSVKKSLAEFYSLDFGVALHNKNARVTDLIWNKAVYSFQYLSFTIVLLFTGAILISFLIMKAKKKDRILFLFRGLNQIPQLVLIPSLIYFFAYLNSYVPLKFDPHDLGCTIFVIVILALKPLSQLIHMTVVKWQKETTEMYAHFARAKGLSKSRILLIHTFKNVANSFLGYFLTIVLQLLTGNFILESLYSIPGFGLGFMDSVLQRDLPMVIGYIFLFSCTYLFLHFVVQILFVYVNPRLRDVG